MVYFFEIPPSSTPVQTLAKNNAARDILIWKSAQNVDDMHLFVKILRLGLRSESSEIDTLIVMDYVGLTDFSASYLI